jgi:hypothetical protein
MPFTGGRKTDLPEQLIRERIRKMLCCHGWYVKLTHGSMFSSGLPDLFTCHTRYGSRWIEVKDPKRTGDIFTAAQLETFPHLCSNGSGVWVLVDDSENEYKKLFERPNWQFYLSIWTNNKSLGG